MFHIFYFVDRNECDNVPNVCRNGGTCINNDGSYTCLCTQSWTGPFCDIGRYPWLLDILLFY
jgi:hypothetical protein